MGLDFIRSKDASYKQKRDTSRLLTDTRDLLDRAPERLRELFGVQLCDPSLQLVAGYRVFVKLESEEKATVYQNGKLIGEMDPDAAGEISRRLKKNGKTAGVFEGLICGEQDISGHFKISPAEPKNIKIDERGPEK